MANPRSLLLDELLLQLSERFVVQDILDREQPIFMAAAFPLQDGLTGLKPRLAAGRGLTRHQARFGAAAETIEMLTCLSMPENPNLARVQRSGGNHQIMARDIVTQKPVAVDARRVFLDYAEVHGLLPDGVTDTTGCAAGQDFTDACSRGILECVERDAKAIWWYGGLSYVDLGIEQLDVIAPRLAWWLYNRQRRTLLIDITTDIGIPVIAAISARGDGTWVAVGTAAHPNLEEAALAAVTEMIHTETAMRHAESAGDPEFKTWLNVASTKTMAQFKIKSASHGRQKRRSIDINLAMTKAGFQVLAIDLTDPRFSLATVRVMVPGFCAMNKRLAAGRLQANGIVVPRTLNGIEPY
jgi:ribosomal protein S12 methylthiotransferase accessory factor YcaO